MHKSAGYLFSRAGRIRLSSDAIRIAIHAISYNTYHNISTLIQQHLEALFMLYTDEKFALFSFPFLNHSIKQTLL